MDVRNKLFYASAYQPPGFQDIRDAAKLADQKAAMQAACFGSSPDMQQCARLSRVVGRSTARIACTQAQTAADQDVTNSILAVSSEEPSYGAIPTNLNASTVAAALATYNPTKGSVLAVTR